MDDLAEFARDVKEMAAQLRSYSKERRSLDFFIAGGMKQLWSKKVHSKNTRILELETPCDLLAPLWSPNVSS